METDSSDSSKGKSGNTKQISPAKHWCFTLNNYTEDDIAQLLLINSSTVPVLVFQEEMETTPHLQGCLSFQTKGRAFGLGLSKKIHWEKKSKYSSLYEARFYCADPDKRAEHGKVWLRGWRPRRIVKTINPVRKWQQDLLEIVKEEPDDRRIYWIMGEGGVGKTSFCKYLTIKHGAICLSGKASDMKNGIIEYTKSHGETPELILINIPRSYNSEYLSYEGIESIKDMYFYSGKYEGGMVCGNPPHLLIFSNEEPNFEKVSADRWNFRKIE